MTTTQGNAIVKGVEEKEGTYKIIKKRFLLFFTLTHEELVSETSFGNDIMIQTTREIRQVYLNGKPLLDNKH